MSHEINTNNVTGQQEAYYANQPAWHKLGTVVDGARVAAEAINLAGLDWEVEQIPVTYNHVSSHEAAAAVLEERQPIAQVIETDRLANVRSDTSECLGVVSQQYRPFQNAEAFAFMDKLAGAGVTYESAGALKGGKVVWLLARLDGADTDVFGDEHRAYCLLANGHDGSFGFQTRLTDVRVVCWNTLSAAIGREGASTFRAQHRGNLQDKVEEARLALSGIRAQHQRQIEDLRKLSTVQLSTPMVQRFLDAIRPFPAKPAAGASERVAEAYAKEAESVEKFRKGIVSNLDDATNKTKAAYGTAYGLLNAFTLHVDHQRRTNPDARLASAWFGQGARDKTAALESVLEVAGAI